MNVGFSGSELKGSSIVMEPWSPRMAHALAAMKLRGTCEAGHSRSKVNDRHGESIRAKRRIQLHAAGHTRRFRLEQVSRHRNPVAPNVHECPASDRSPIANVGGVHVPVREYRVHSAQRSNGALPDHFAGVCPLGVVPVHERLGDLDARMRFTGGDQCGAVVCGKTQGFFAQHVLARFDCFHSIGYVKVVGEWNVDSVDGRSHSGASS